MGLDAIFVLGTCLVLMRGHTVDVDLLLWLADLQEIQSNLVCMPCYFGRLDYGNVLPVSSTAGPPISIRSSDTTITHVLQLPFVSLPRRASFSPIAEKWLCQVSHCRVGTRWLGLWSIQRSLGWIGVPYVSGFGVRTLVLSCFFFPWSPFMSCLLDSVSPYDGHTVANNHWFSMQVVFPVTDLIAQAGSAGQSFPYWCRVVTALSVTRSDWMASLLQRCLFLSSGQALCYRQYLMLITWKYASSSMCGSIITCLFHLKGGGSYSFWFELPHSPSACRSLWKLPNPSYIPFSPTTGAAV